MAGTLFVVSTPIGNLADLSPRARETLTAVQAIACEDTRHTGRLLAYFGIKAQLISLHDHNETRRVPEIIGRLEQGDDIALVSDAGTPLVADPGFPLVRAAASRGLAIRVVPGPSAMLAALTVSALPPYPVTFAGFAPRKAGKRRAFLAEMAALGHTCVVFESPHRILATLAVAAEEFAERPVALCRELTKLHEEVLRGTAAEILATLAARPAVKGEIVLVFGPSVGQATPTAE
jgi:16S rRNA (cytidine1402-2'-O)-methyltransferase